MGNIFRTRRNGWTPEMETAQVQVGNTFDGTEWLAKAVQSMHWNMLLIEESN